MEKVYKLYEVGGCVRDWFLALKSKDIDYSFEFTKEFISDNKSLSALGFYNKMNEILKEEGYTIHLEVPEAFTTRGKFPTGHEHEGLDADFVMCRKETYPNKFTRMPVAEIGTLLDDLTRRDFTVNAMAIDDKGVLIDPFNGLEDLRNKILKCPVTVSQSFNDDPLRMLRALRFSITKGFMLSKEIEDVISNDAAMWDKFATVVSTERIREEFVKMFEFDTIASMKLLVELSAVSKIDILKYLFRGEIWFTPTTKKVKKQKKL